MCIRDRYRATDSDPKAAQGRYKVFKERTYDALQSLREVFHYHFINAQGELPEVRRNILRELKYQSSLELDPRTFDSVHLLPLASELVKHARQELVKRLDGYEFQHADLFHEVIRFIKADIMPIVMNHAISGSSHVNSENRILANPFGGRCERRDRAVEDSFSSLMFRGRQSSLEGFQ